jgi:hypothetical protein
MHVEAREELQVLVEEEDLTCGGSHHGGDVEWGETRDQPEFDPGRPLWERCIQDRLSPAAEDLVVHGHPGDAQGMCGQHDQRSVGPVLMPDDELERVDRKKLTQEIRLG